MIQDAPTPDELPAGTSKPVRQRPYVNEFNHPARRVYEQVVFRWVGTFASILF
jgi:hypothetical protein